MPNWNEVLKEVSLNPLDQVRRKYLKELHELTGRNIICYYSGWLQKNNNQASINDGDKNSFMAVVHGLDRTKGLDLILHTPGGDIAATESIVNYLRKMFGIDIRVIIPQIAMSAGTMIACSAKEIIMGKQSNIGPIDPQFGGIPAHGVLEEFEKALKEVKRDPSSIPIWQTVVQKYHPTFLGDCEKAISLSTELVTDWLKTGMFLDDTKIDENVKKIVEKLNNHTETKTHSRHLHLEDAKEMGLKIINLEDNQKLQDLVLTVHHTYMHSLGNSNVIKIVENHDNNAVVQSIPLLPDR